MTALNDETLAMHKQIEELKEQRDVWQKEALELRKIVAELEGALAQELAMAKRYAPTGRDYIEYCKHEKPSSLCNYIICRNGSGFCATFGCDNQVEPIISLHKMHLCNVHSGNKPITTIYGVLKT